MTYSILIEFLQVQRAGLESSMDRIGPPGRSLPTAYVDGAALHLRVGGLETPELQHRNLSSGMNTEWCLAWVCSLAR